VTLIDGTTYDHGAGNLCVNCHRSRNSSAVIATLTWPNTTLDSNADSPHHGVQSDFILGRNAWEFVGNTYVGTAAHATATADSCVSCHKFVKPNGNNPNSGSLQLGGHAFYQAAQIGAPNALTAWKTYSETDQVALCQTCHTTMTGTTFPTSHTASADWANIGAGRDKLVEIRALRDKLLVYFFGLGVVTLPAAGSGTWWNGTAAGLTYPAPWTAATVTIEWNRDFVIKSGVSIPTQAQGEAFWNLQLFLEDRSGGIHNPTFAAQILYDSLVAVGLGGGLGPRPTYP